MDMEVAPRNGPGSKISTGEEDQRLLRQSLRSQALRPGRTAVFEVGRGEKNVAGEVGGGGPNQPKSGQKKGLIWP